MFKLHTVVVHNLFFFFFLTELQQTVKGNENRNRELHFQKLETAYLCALSFLDKFFFHHDFFFQ